MFVCSYICFVVRGSKYLPLISPCAKHPFENKEKVLWPIVIFNRALFRKQIRLEIK